MTTQIVEDQYVIVEGYNKQTMKNTEPIFNIGPIAAVYLQAQKQNVK